MSKALLEHEAKQMLVDYNIPVLDFTFCESYDQLKSAAIQYGFPVVIKIVSPQIVHKSEAGGVKLNIKNENELRTAYDAMLESSKQYDPAADIRGVLLSPFIPGGLEVIVGSVTDPQFGPVMMVGLGGIFVEIFKDVAFGVTPIDQREAMEMLASLKAYPMLQGARGKAGTSLTMLSDLMVKLSHLIEEKSIVELDLNPIFCFPDHIMVADARLIVDE